MRGPNFSKSFSERASFTFVITFGTSSFAHFHIMSGSLSTLNFIPSVLGTSFLPYCTTKIMHPRVHSFSLITYVANDHEEISLQSSLASSNPRCHSTKPPKRDLEAEPEPNRARMVSCYSET